jgi:Domain of unknown function (DUF1905)
MGSLSLTTTLVRRGPAAAVVLDEQQVAAIGEGAKRFPVVATVNGYSWQTSVTRMGGEFLLGRRTSRWRSNSTRHRGRVDGIEETEWARQHAVVDLQFNEWFHPFDPASHGVPHPFNLD